MDAEITSLAQNAGTTLVTLMATDAWERARGGMVRLWHRFQPDRAASFTAELESSDADALTAAENGHETAFGELQAQWQARMRRLLASHPEAAEPLRCLLDEIDPPESALPSSPVTLRATASGDARVCQAGRDQHVTER